MKIDYSLVTRRTFLNTLLGGWLASFSSGSLYALSGSPSRPWARSPISSSSKPDDFLTIPANSTKPFAWGGKVGLFFKRADNRIVALKGVCTHMECNIVYKPEDRRFYCPCHKGWFDENGRNMRARPRNRSNSSSTG